MEKAGRLLSNTAILGAGTFASKVLVFLLMPLYTSILSASEYGVADVLTLTATLIMPLASVGICDALFRFMLDVGEDELDKAKTVFSSAVLVIFAGSVVTAVMVRLLGAFDVFDGYIWLVALYVISANIHSAAAYFVRSLGRTSLFAIQGIANTILTILLNVVFLVVFDMGVLGYVLSVVVSDFVMSIVLVIAARLYSYVSLRSLNKKTLSAMLKFSIPYIPTTMMWLVTSACDRYIVTAYKGTAENGLYAAAYKLPTILLLACGVFIEAWQFSVVKDTDDEAERTRFFSRVFKNYSGIIFMFGAIIIALSKFLTSILLADSYYSSWKYVPILVVAMAFSSMVSFLGSVYFLEKKSLLSMLTSMAGAVINVVLNFILIPSRGAMGAAIATLISYVAVYAIRAYDTKYYIKFNMNTPRIIINSVVLMAQAMVMIFEVKYGIFFQIFAVLFVFAFNGKEIVETAQKAYRKIVKKAKTGKKI